MMVLYMVELTKRQQCALVGRDHGCWKAVVGLLRLV